MNQILAQLDQIVVNPFQPASGLDVEKVNEIAESLKLHRDNGAKGLHQVPVARQVDGHYELAFGRHRLHAFRQLAAGDPFFAFMPLILREIPDEEMYTTMLSENLDRRGISLVEIGEIFHDFMARFSKTSVECAQAFGRTEEYVRSAVRMLNLPAEGRQALQAGEITVTTARELLTVQKLTGGEGVQRALHNLQAKVTYDTPQEAIQAVLNSSDQVEELPSRAPWLSEKKFPVKYLVPISQQKLLNLFVPMFDEKDGNGSKRMEELRTLTCQMLDHPGEPVRKGFPLLSANEYAYERALAYASLPACTACPVHAVIGGDHYCGFKTCMSRKMEAWARKEIDDKAKELGIKLYVNEATDGECVELETNNQADQKLFKDRHADLRLKPSRSTKYWNFQGVPSSLVVVAVGELAKTRLAKMAEPEKAAPASKADKARAEKKANLDRAIEQLEEQAFLRFQWEVAAPAFAAALDGLTNPDLLLYLFDEMMDANHDADFPEGVDDQWELLEQAKKMKKADQLKMYRRLMMFHTFWHRVAYGGMGIKRYQGILQAKSVVTACAAELAKVAEQWGIKLGATFTQSAEKYQAELDEAIKELKAKK